MRELVIKTIREWMEQHGLNKDTAPKRKNELTRWSYLRARDLRIWEDGFLENATDEQLVESLQMLTACVFRGWA